MNAQQEVVKQVLDARDCLAADDRYGPYAVILPMEWEGALQMPYCAYSFASYLDITLEARLLGIVDIMMVYCAPVTKVTVEQLEPTESYRLPLPPSGFLHLEGS